MGLTARTSAALFASLLAAQAVHAQTPAPRPAAGAEVFFSTDSEDTEVLRTAIEFDLRNAGPDRRTGVRLERVRYTPGGGPTVTRERAFVQLADVAGGWTWHLRLGTDGDSVIGAASLHDDARFRKEFFVERDVVETREGLARGIYATFAGAAIDLPASERDVFTALAGVQTFTGGNTRLHLRGNYVHVLDPGRGLSAQLRTRYFTSSEPGQFDYYSPRWYAQALPVLQVRRFVSGWELVAAGGLGLQRDAATPWRRSDYAHLRFRSPPASGRWFVRGELTYTNTPSDTAASGAGYSYLQTMLGVTARF